MVITTFETAEHRNYYAKSDPAHLALGSGLPPLVDGPEGKASRTNTGAPLCVVFGSLLVAHDINTIKIPTLICAYKALVSV
jgi:hypothetical protein